MNCFRFLRSGVAVYKTSNIHNVSTSQRVWLFTSAKSPRARAFLQRFPIAQKLFHHAHKTTRRLYTDPPAPKGRITIPVGVKKLPKTLGVWLLVCAGMSAGAILLGGATRLTESGLSMVHWKLLGERRPRSDFDWEVEFQRYQLYPEYQ